MATLDLFHLPSFKTVSFSVDSSSVDGNLLIEALMEDIKPVVLEKVRLEYQD